MPSWDEVMGHDYDSCRDLDCYLCGRASYAGIRKPPEQWLNKRAIDEITFKPEEPIMSLNPAVPGPALVPSPTLEDWKGLDRLCIEMEVAGPRMDWPCNISCFNKNEAEWLTYHLNRRGYYAFTCSWLTFESNRGKLIA